MPMILRLILSAVVMLLAALPGCAAPATQPDPPTAETAAPDPRPINPHQSENDRFVGQLLQEIAGREQLPAEAVFENIQTDSLKQVPAGRFLRIMNAGYARALGVACTHCHESDNFAADSRRPKLAAREMAAMHSLINQQLAAMEHLDLEPKQRFINCTTCHRGQVEP